MNPFDLYDKVAVKENVNRQDVKIMAISLVYGMKIKSDDLLEAKLTEMVQLAKQMGYIKEKV